MPSRAGALGQIRRVYVSNEVRPVLSHYAQMYVEFGRANRVKRNQRWLQLINDLLCIFIVGSESSDWEILGTQGVVSHPVLPFSPISPRPLPLDKYRADSEGVAKRIRSLNQLSKTGFKRQYYRLEVSYEHRFETAWWLAVEGTQHKRTVA